MTPTPLAVFWSHTISWNGAGLGLRSLLVITIPDAAPDTRTAGEDP